MRLLRFEPPVVEEVAAQAELLGEFGNRLPCRPQFNRLRLKLGCVLFAFFGLHSWSFVLVGSGPRF